MTKSMKGHFDHEGLDVYRQAIVFVQWLDGVLEQLPKNIDVHERLDHAATAIPLHIAEARGKFTSSDRSRAFDTARGCAIVCAACLDVLAAKARLGLERVAQGKEILQPLVAMLDGLVKTTSAEWVYEKPAVYRVAHGARPPSARSDSD